MPGALITKKALAHAMRTLMQEEAFRRISVGDICERCGMSRKSFYYHFRDKYELVNWIFDQDFIALVRDRSYDNAWEFFEDLCTVLELKAISQRLQVAKMLSEHYVYNDIVNATGASTATISRVNRSLNYGNDGYELVFDRMEKKSEA